jgi:hypothetical protein
MQCLCLNSHQETLKNPQQAPWRHYWNYTKQIFHLTAASTTPASRWIPTPTADHEAISGPKSFNRISTCCQARYACPGTVTQPLLPVAPGLKTLSSCWPLLWSLVYMFIYVYMYVFTGTWVWTWGLCLLGRSSTAWAVPPALLLWLFWR